MLAPIRFVGKVESTEMVRAYKLAWRDTWQMTARILFYCLLGIVVAAMALLNAVVLLVASSPTAS